MNKDNYKKQLFVNNQAYDYYDIKQLEQEGYGRIEQLPYSIRILLEGALRQLDDKRIVRKHVEDLANWNGLNGEDIEIPFIPSRIILQDFTGVPAVVDLAVMRDAIALAGKDPNMINPLVPVDLVIDHSIMVDYAGTADALDKNVAKEFERNGERYQFLKWAQSAFDNFTAVPPSTGIIHQVNLEYLASVALTKEENGVLTVYPDSLVGTDSHTTMINGLGVVGWGVGGIEAEAGMLGQPLYFIMPEVVGLKMTGRLPEGTNATDLALVVTELLRKHKVVGKFVEYFGEGLSGISLQDRATVANMAPEYGATMGFFPVDDVTLAYLTMTGRSKEQVDLVKAYYEKNQLFRIDGASDPLYSQVVELDLSTVASSLAGPKRPQDRINLKDMKSSFEEIAVREITAGGYGVADMSLLYDIDLGSQIESHKTRQINSGSNGDNGKVKIGTGSVVLAAITSCTNTSNPTVMIGAGLVAKKAVALGLKKPAYVKSSLTPGSRVVTDYLAAADVLGDLEALGFNVAGYGCATCIGNSGPLAKVIEDTIDEHNMTVASVLSGNRNFEGRIHAKIKANYLASPMLVVAYALAGTVRIDFDSEPIGYGHDNQPVYLKDIWPTSMEIEKVVTAANKPELYTAGYSSVYSANKEWDSIKSEKTDLYPWEEASTYIQAPPFFDGLLERDNTIQPIKDAAILALLNDSVTTDHISPAGAIGKNTPAGQYLDNNGVDRADFNSYGSRRGNHQVMMRGTFANIRIKNQLAPGTEGGVTKYLPTGEIMSIYDAAMKYQDNKKALVILAGKEYGTGSSRDWAAKGTQLLGVKAVIAESYERIHRSNLVGMGVLPLQFKEGDSWMSLGLTGNESLSILDVGDDIQTGQDIVITVESVEGKVTTFKVICRLDSQMDIEYYRNGGILHTVLKGMIE
ncbi:MAG: aconitate hydratase AcnA [Vallitaleaceae bacterium]|jgi:aconitate hydratase|nr:aconitate hydratase AcnA [Vallitaleaceae bacterium]